MSHEFTTLSAPDTFQDERVKRPPVPADEIPLFSPDLGSLFSKRPLILGEDGAAYEDLLTKVTCAATPRDAIEALWVKDIVDEIWKAERYKRLKASLLMHEAKSILVRRLKGARDLETDKPLAPDYAEVLAVCCLTGEEDSVAEVEEILKASAADLDTIMAEALANRLDTVERLDRLISVAHATCRKTLAEIERRREPFARRLQAASRMD